MSTDLNPDTEDTRRDELRVKIEASERRIAERTLSDQAREAAESAVEYTKANPLKVIGGALAVGLLIGLMTKPGRRVATSAVTSAAGAATSAASAVGGAATSAAKTVGDATGKRGSRFGALIADALVGYGIALIDNVMDGAQASKDKLEDVGDSATAKARELRREATYIAGSAADKTRTATRRTRRRAERAVRDLTERVRG